MEFANLGRTGVKVSRICLGMMTYGSKKWRDWVLEEEESRPFIERALELGINFFDTADVYSTGVSEEILGRAIKHFSPNREKVVIATKVHGVMSPDINDRGLSRKHIMHAIDASLHRLGTDYVDLYQIHRFDPHTPMEETLEALHDVVKAGKALYIGASSMYAWQMAKMLSLSDQNKWSKFVTMQNHYNLLYREEEREMNPLCKSEGVGLIPWSPLARGLLAGSRTGKTLRSTTDGFANVLYGKEVADADQAIIGELNSLAEAKEVPPAQVALAWMLHKPGVVAPIIGASKQHHLDDAVAALKIKLTPEEMKRLETPYIPHAIAGHD